jgi:tripartite-type tricarboxylate transporter receptor subunit TctC
VTRLRNAARAAAADAAVRQTIAGAGSPVLYVDAPEFQSYINDDAKKMKEAVQKIGKVE